MIVYYNTGNIIIMAILIAVASLWKFGYKYVLKHFFKKPTERGYSMNYST